MNRHAKKELREIYDEIGKLPRSTFPAAHSLADLNFADHEYIDTCLIYKMLQRRMRA